MTYPSSVVTMVRGDDFQFDVFVTDNVTGDPVDITGNSLWFTAKRRYFFDDPDPETTIKKDNLTPSGGIQVLDALGGQARVFIDAADTDGYTKREVFRFDVQWKDSNDFLHTLTRGDFIVELDVTRRTT